MDTLRYDLTQATRSLLRAPHLTATVVLTLAVGIAVVSGFFSLLNGILFRPLPYAESHEIVRLQETRPDRSVTAGWVSPHTYRALEGGSGSFESVGMYEDARINLATDDWVTSVPAVRMEPTTLDLLGVAPALGRSLGPADAFTGAPTVALLGHDLWTRRFEADPAVLGHIVRVDGDPVQVVGVMPEGFVFPDRGELWLPFERPRGEVLADGDWSVAARLADRTTPEEARAELSRTAAGLADEGLIPAGSRLWMTELVNRAAGGFGPLMGLLLGVGVFVLMVVCSNVASLLLARSARRRSEMAVRSALGASRERLIVQALMEGLTLAALAGALGLVLSTWMVNGFLVALDVPYPAWFEPQVDLRVVSFTALVSAASVLLFGLPAALEGSKVNLAGSLSAGSQGVTGGRRARRVRGTVIALEVAFAFVLVTGAVLMATSVARVEDLDFGVDGHRVLQANVLLRGDAYDAPETRDEYYRTALDRIEALPGVEVAALEGRVHGLRALDENRDPHPDSILRGTLVPENGEPLSARQAILSVVTPGYFRTMGLEILRGRALSPSDREGTVRVAVVSEALADRLWPGEDPVGRIVRAGGIDGLALTVVGVVEEHRRLVGFGSPGGGAARVEPGRHLYLPFAQATTHPFILARSAREGAEALAPGVRSALREVDPHQAVTSIHPASANHERLADAFGIIVWLVLGLAGVGAGLATLGIYGVIAQGVAERTREIGVRTALGGSVRRIVRMVMADGLKLAGWGLAAGLVLSLLFTRVLGSLLYDVAPTSPVVLGGVALFFLGVGAAASALPARQATRVDPSVALRAE